MIYIDKKSGNGWSHLIADTLQELHEFADNIGLRRSWFQQKKDRPHYDVKGMMRERAMKYGAIEISSKGIVEILKERYQYS